MATIETDTGKKDLISPTMGKYYETLVWILDEKTKKPIRVEVEKTFTE